VVSAVEAFFGRISRSDLGVYVAAQVFGAFVGVAAAHLMFEEPLFSASTHARAGLSQALSEFIATFGLVTMIQGTSHTRPRATPLAVAGYITAAYWFTASTSFANPAVTLARSASNTFAGIRPIDVPAFVVAQVLGGAAAAILFRWLLVPMVRQEPTRGESDGTNRGRTHVQRPLSLHR
jgi:glycerol uptake facilitator-like aquaporin